MEKMLLQLDPAKLKAAREAAGLTQRQMGEILGVTKAQVSNKETGFSKIDADELMLWCRACEIQDVSALYSEAAPQAFYTRKKRLAVSTT